MNQELRQQVLERDNYTCQCCGCNGKRLDVHHIIPFSNGGPDSLDNLISLCPKCHKVVEPFKRRSEGNRTGTTTLSKAGPISNSMRTTVPSYVVKMWGLELGGKINWKWDKIDDEIVIVLRKV